MHKWLPALLGLLLAPTLVLAAEKRTPPTPAEADAVKDKALVVTMITTKGTMKIKLFTDSAPYTCANFKKLADSGFYNGIKFHRVIPDFMAQGGDPTGTGRGGPGYKFKDEASALQNKHDGPGVLSMANAGPNTNGSQFFLTHKSTPWLNGKHAVFGKIIEGMPVLYKIGNGDTMTRVTVEDAHAEK